MNKKFWRVLPLLLLCLIVSATAFVSCTKKDPTDDPGDTSSGETVCEHEWVKGNTVPSTCVALGYIDYTCSKCKATKRENLTKLSDDHTTINHICTLCGARTPSDDKFDGGSDIVLYFYQTTGFSSSDDTEYYEVDVVGNGAINSYSAKSLPSWAVKYKNNIAKVNFVGDITEIGDYAFFGCTELTTVTFNGAMKKIGAHAFDGCTKLTEAVCGDNISNVGVYAFANCTSLNTVKFSARTERVGEFALYNCTALRTLSLGKVGAVIDGDNTELGNIFGAAFGYTTEPTPNAIQTVTINTANYYFFIPERLTVVNILGDGQIPNNAFYKCKSVSTVNINGEITEIGARAFNGMTKLEFINFGADTLLSIGDRAFADSASLTAIIIPSTVTEIGVSAFEGCGGLTSVIYKGDAVSSIKARTFANCSKLASIDLSDGIESIVGGAFSNCSSLPEIIIKEKVASLAENSFSGCTSLSSVFIESENVCNASGNNSKLFTNVTKLYVKVGLTPSQAITVGYVPKGLDANGYNLWQKK